MGPTEMETVIKFLMSKLSEPDLAELDALLAGEGRAENLAEDSARGTRGAWLAMDAKTRHGVRKGRQQTAVGRSETYAEAAKTFPHMHRLG
ncbi:hypothetical protein [Methylobacterium nonmethylotrophicum]|uniref:Uncharacterized protein n=1 Tax=Methylobacterium nonmethylotrophicum TaxID=1141884 RepID=A0A4Z0NKB7_9HYPH|nr:hypothetical protein [Methylobacterium nonmethylotrophicum]TGD96206.1 hypothetical protein EU555_24960 [Methylobacterium nonmethylotrophicum]